MYLDANEELHEIEPESRHLPDVLAIRVDAYCGLEKWDLTQTVARNLALDQPDNPQWFVSWAHATRRADSIDAARLILLTAVETLPSAAVVRYNLACYECLLGDVEVAKARLRHAFKLDLSLRRTALEDEDLEPIWALLTSTL